MKSIDEITKKVVEIGKKYPNYDFCSYGVSTLAHANGVIAIKHVASVFYRKKGLIGCETVSAPECDNIYQMFKVLRRKLKDHFDKEIKSIEGALVDAELKLENFKQINFGIYIYQDDNNEFIYQQKTPYDKERMAQDSDHIFIKTKLCTYNKGVADLTEALKIFNAEFRW